MKQRRKSMRLAGYDYAQPGAYFITPLSQIVGSFKSFSARRIRAAGDAAERPVWQRGFYEHVIRNERDLASIREYIANNPLQWELDEENPSRERRKR